MKKDEGIIYVPKDEAREYAPLALNIYKGCVHGCRYCYGPDTTRVSRERYYAEANAKKDVIARTKESAEKYRGDDREILLSFIGDVYQPMEMELQLTREAIKILIKNDLRFTILTKGGMRAVRDFDLLEGYPKARFGTTLIFMHQAFSDKWEANAAPIAERVQAIREARERGISTWVSVEPIILPFQALTVIRKLAPIVDHWKVGKINHKKELERRVDWRLVRKQVEALLKSLDADYYLKESLRKL
jgi:DNA repair photolyase